jgi:hypothetical protein
VTLYDEITSIERRLRSLVAYFNEDEQWKPGMRAQAAIVQVHNIFGGDFDSEQEYTARETACEVKP